MELGIEQLTKKFGDFTAVDHVSCSMGQGVYGLLGANGAGKTTMMRMLATLLEPTEGSVTYDGTDIFQMDGAYRRLLGYLPQDFGFYPELTVTDYLMYIASIKGIPHAAAQKRVKNLLHLVGLEKVRGWKMKKLSGGMKRRAGIAQAMLNNPRVLILDEPTAGLDPNERIRFRNLLSELAAERIVLLSTHIVSDVEYIADQILILKEGHMICSGTVSEVTASMKTQVWSMTVGRREAKAYAKRFRVANMRKNEESAERVELRILSENKPAPEAVSVSRSLEDVFLYYFGEKEENGNDIL